MNENGLLKRYDGLDLLKVIAAIFITNSHFQPLYEDVNVGLATFGVHGNALFFFVSGFLLMMGFERHNNMNFIDWYKARIRRLWPSVFIWVIVAAAFWGQSLSVGKLVWADGYWFLQSIAVNYILFYFLLKVLSEYLLSITGEGKNIIQIIVFASSFIVSVAYFFYMPMAEGSPFHTDFHFVCHFSIMVMGAMIYSNKDKMECNRIGKDLVGFIFSFCLYFVLLAVGKGRTDVLYYVQILALIPLHLFIYYAYKVASYKWTASLFKSKYIGGVLNIVANLTLEIYVVQFVIITNKWNALFPLNILIIFSLICFAAYSLKVMTSLFLAVMSKESLQWRSLLTFR